MASAGFNPNKFIKGYNDARARWEKRVATKTMLSNLSQEEKDMMMSAVVLPRP